MALVAIRLRLSGTPPRELSCEYGLCALLRDNVEYHLGEAAAARDFPALCELADLVWRGPVRIPAERLARDLDRARVALADLSITHVAVGSRTRAALSGAKRPPPGNSASLLRLSDSGVPLRVADHETLGELFAPLIGRVLQLCAQAESGALLDCAIERRSAAPPP